MDNLQQHLNQMINDAVKADGFTKPCYWEDIEDYLREAAKIEIDNNYKIVSISGLAQMYNIMLNYTGRVLAMKEYPITAQQDETEDTWVFIVSSDDINEPFPADFDGLLKALTCQLSWNETLDRGY